MRFSAACGLFLAAIMVAAPVQRAAAQTSRPRPCTNAQPPKVTIANDNPAAGLAAGAYSVAEAQQHFTNADTSGFYSETGTSFSCVDARSTYPILGTPGGDLAEVMGAIGVYLKQTNKPIVEATVRDVFRDLMDAPDSPFTSKRPLYFHTDDTKLRGVFQALADSGVTPKPVVFPTVAPISTELREKWMQALTADTAQGCGHIRLMISRFGDYGLDSDVIPKTVIRAFYNFWWGTPYGSPERSRVKFSIVQGPLIGKAVAIVGSDACPGRAPAVTPSYGGSQVFIYHDGPVGAFREKVLTPWFVAYATRRSETLDSTAFLNALKALQSKQLGATLTYLSPANALRIVKADLNKK